MTRVVVVGSFNLDHAWTATALPRPGETVRGRSARGPGGKGFNQAVAATRAGAGTTFVCALGDDVAAGVARGMAREEGIDLRADQRTVPTGTAGIFDEAGGTNSNAIAAGANGELGAAFVDAQADAFSGAGAVLAQLEVPVDAVRTALRRGRDAGIPTLLNPAPADAATTPDLLALCDVLTPNETEFAALLARHLGRQVDPADLAGTDDPRLHAWCRELLPHGRVVLTLGPAGCFVSHPDDAPDRTDGGGPIAFHRVPAERVDPIDSTGAGDAFSGALAAALALDLKAPFRRHLRFAGRYAALATEQAGAAVAMPRLGDVRARFPD